MASSEGFSDRLKNYRKVMGWTQEQLAKEWTYSTEAISAWERGVRIPGSQQLPRIANLLQIAPEELIQSLNTNRGKKNAQGTVPVIDEEGLKWKSALETWGEIQNIYRDRSKLSRGFSYPRAFEEAHDICVIGISLNAIALSHSREEIIRSVIEKSTTYTLCFLDPDGKQYAEREREENLPTGFLASLIRFNLKNVESILNDISKRSPENVEQFKVLTYDFLPRYSIYMFDNTLMTVQSYAYGRGEDTPCFLLQRQSQSGLFEFYATAVRHIIENAKPFTPIT
jgi:transcriptional regulator with XRE-family HTH domain